MTEGLLIGELSRRVNLPAQTIRYYERVGLLSPPKRTVSHYRIYSAAAAERLDFIQKAKRFGLSLDQIKRLIDLRQDGVPPCADLKAMVKQHLAELDQHIQDMLNLRQELAHRYEHIEAALSNSSELPDEIVCNGKICGLIEQDIGDNPTST
ncbi:MerR family DNA-binding protein [Romeria aff. gracilis LEGE 07310]|uniref:MerR family DNA-binding protein n=1 Tax=Vasconcelosia minhoensis LEGE 07310 TaxID=915328 RepID=A0A8J7ASA5_9CYAN|nr:MerR family DNA-binding protein [Romeria gracilis]MBE9079771.1 MerR family DNA-binding protein [Romeria aff. gracilis LEGE 07310]